MAPGTNIDVSKEWMECMFSNQIIKVVFICGDYNIDLLNPNKHKATEEFINIIYSLNLFPKITRITLNCVTLNDNI